MNYKKGDLVTCLFKDVEDYYYGQIAEVIHCNKRSTKVKFKNSITMSFGRSTSLKLYSSSMNRNGANS